LLPVFPRRPAFASLRDFLGALTDRLVADCPFI
jgi:hypothetical protein